MIALPTHKDHSRHFDRFANTHKITQYTYQSNCVTMFTTSTSATKFFPVSRTTKAVCQGYDEHVATSDNILEDLVERGSGRPSNDPHPRLDYSPPSRCQCHSASNKPNDTNGTLGLLVSLTLVDTTGDRCFSSAFTAFETNSIQDKFHAVFRLSSDWFYIRIDAPSEIMQ